jgi:hypothetical protein
MFNADATQSAFTQISVLTTYGYKWAESPESDVSIYQGNIALAYEVTSAGGLRLDQSTDQCYNYGPFGEWDGQPVG